MSGDLQSQASKGSTPASFGGVISVVARVKKYAGRTLAIVGGITLVGAGLAAWEVRQRGKLEDIVSKSFILELDLETTAVVEKYRPNIIDVLRGEERQLGMRQLIQALKAAGQDENCKGLLAYVGPRESFQGGLAQVQEVREAVNAFKAAASQRLHAADPSRPVAVAFSSSFGEGGTQGTLPYYFASAFDSIYVQPTGLVSTTGFGSTFFFLRDMLDKLKIKPQFLTREEYKNAANMFTESAFNEPHRESMECVINNFADQVVEGIASARKLDVSVVNSHIDNAPYMAKDAAALGLIDGLKYKDEVVDLVCGKKAAKSSSKDNLLEKAKTKLTGDDTKQPEQPIRRVSIQQYVNILETRRHTADEGREREELQRALTKKTESDVKRWFGQDKTGDQVDTEASDLNKLKQKEKKPHIALLMLSGPIMQGGPGTPPPPPDPSGQSPNQIESRKLAKQIQELAELESVKAVVIRVNSPGGSAVASDTIYREVVKLKEAGKKVIVSMGDVAASGGYFISAPADKIVAQPGTLTGSIGVILGKFNAGGLLNELGVNVETITVGKNADAQSGFQDWSPEQLEHADKLIEGIYRDFLAKVSQGRNISMSKAAEVAKGRVWTGSQAKALGLVDELGGLDRALEIARDAAGLPKEEDISTQVLEYPKQKIPPWLRFFKNMGNSRPSGIVSHLAHSILDPVLPQSSHAMQPVTAASPLWHLPSSFRQSIMAIVNNLQCTEGPQMLSWESEALRYVR